MLKYDVLTVVFACIYYVHCAFSGDPVVIQLKSNTHYAPLKAHNINITGDDFKLDGQTLKIMSGSLHYFRLPAAYWRDRLQKLKAAGLNSVSTYVEWSFHEPEERQYRFDGDRDVARFVRLAAEEGLHVLLRPGPYICAERDLGGFPYWLLGKYPDIKLRSTDKDFMNESKIWLEKLFSEIKPLLFGNGGPIILVQVENEYGSYGSDKAYKEAMRDLILQHVGTNALLYTTDGNMLESLAKGNIGGVLSTADFGPGQDMKEAVRVLRTVLPQGPMMNSEYYPGWLTHWGERPARVATDLVVDTLRDMINNNFNFNFYMFFGGTNFEFTAGANQQSRLDYRPDITSYDYDAPLNEAGDPTPKYYAVRDFLLQHPQNRNIKHLPRPEPAPKGDYGEVTLTPRISLLDKAGRDILSKAYPRVQGSALPTFEHLHQRAGLVLYETTLSETNGILHIYEPRDVVYIFVNNKFQGFISRMCKYRKLSLNAKPGSVLSLLVENHGRINFGPRIHDFKGILSTVEYYGKILNGDWNVTGYSLETVNIPEVTSTSADSRLNETSGPVLYDAKFILPIEGPPLDTFIDPTGWTKGFIWINGYNLGRYWPVVGPQVTLYVPGVWLKRAPEENHIQILELMAPPDNLTVKFIGHDILNRTSPMQC